MVLAARRRRDGPLRPDRARKAGLRARRGGRDSRGRAAPSRTLPRAVRGSLKRHPWCTASPFSEATPDYAADGKTGSQPHLSGFSMRRRSHSVCTAFCVGDDVVATAGHCLFRTDGERPLRLKGVEFRLKPRGGAPSSTPIAGGGHNAEAQHVAAGSRKLRMTPADRRRTGLGPHEAHERRSAKATRCRSAARPPDALDQAVGCAARLPGQPIIGTSETGSWRSARRAPFGVHSAARTGRRSRKTSWMRTTSSCTPATRVGRRQARPC